MSFAPATPPIIVHPHPAHSPQKHRSHSPVCHHLMFGDEESPVRTNTSDSRAEPSSQLQHHMAHHHTSKPSTDDTFQDVSHEEEEDFQTAQLIR